MLLLPHQQHKKGLQSLKIILSGDNSPVKNTWKWGAVNPISKRYAVSQACLQSKMKIKALFSHST